MSLLLVTPRLEISPIGADDIPVFVAYRRVPEVAQYQSWGTDYSTMDAEALVAAQPMSGIPEPGEWEQLGLRAAAAPGDPGCWWATSPVPHIAVHENGPASRRSAGPFVIQRASASATRSRSA